LTRAASIPARTKAGDQVAILSGFRRQRNHDSHDAVRLLRTKTRAVSARSKRSPRDQGIRLWTRAGRHGIQEFVNKKLVRFGHIEAPPTVTVREKALVGSGRS
jgi:hypothetical protein